MMFRSYDFGNNDSDTTATNIATTTATTTAIKTATTMLTSTMFIVSVIVLVGKASAYASRALLVP